MFIHFSLLLLVLLLIYYIKKKKLIKKEIFYLYCLILFILSQGIYTRINKRLKTSPKHIHILTVSIKFSYLYIKLLKDYYIFKLLLVFAILIFSHILYI